MVKIVNGHAYNAIDLTGETFGVLTVLGWGRKSGKHRLWTCQCACGVIKDIRRELLISGKAQSCGCAKSRLISHKKKQHGLASHPLYSIWTKMIGRCTKPTAKAWKYYGARGISVCEEWTNDVWAFFAWAVSRNGFI